VKEVVRLNDDGTPSERLEEWITSYAYDLNDNLTHIRDSQKQREVVRYDGLKRKLFMNDPDRGTCCMFSILLRIFARPSMPNHSESSTRTMASNRLLTEKYHDGLAFPAWRAGIIEGDVASSNSVVYHYDLPRVSLPIGDGQLQRHKTPKAC
jgi:YD repeat-containing protein